MYSVLSQRQLHLNANFAEPFCEFVFQGLALKFGHSHDSLEKTLRSWLKA